MIEGTGLFIGMFNNLAVFIVFVALYSQIKPLPLKKSLLSLPMGLLFSFALIICMRVRIPVAKGVYVDQRNGIIVLSTLFGGPLSGLMTMLTGFVMRITLGGSGVLAGIIGMGLSFGAGNLLSLWKGKRTISFFLIAGLLATIIILPGFLFVGNLANGWTLLKKMALPYGTALYLGMIFVGLLLQHEENRLTSERGLRISEEKYRTLYGNLLDVNFQVSDDRITEISPSARKVLAYSPEELKGRRIVDIYHRPEERKEFLSSLDKDGEVNNFELEIQRGDGRTAWVSVSAVHDYDASGQIRGYHGLIRDITKLHKTLEDKEELEKIINQKQKMDALGTLAGGVAHDFNNILSGVMGYAELIRNEGDDRGHIGEYADYIIEASERASALIRQIMLFSRNTSMRKERVDLTGLIREVLSLLGQIIPKTVTIDYENRTDYPFIWADPNQIHQVILNLTMNAYHALANKQGRILIILEDEIITAKNRSDFPDLPPGNFLKVSVADNGKGIPDNIRPFIFDPFFTTKEKERGTGLGLSVVHGIVRKHGGSIHFTSEVGTGSVFIILLPRFREEGGAP